MSRVTTYRPSELSGSPIARLLFSDTRLAWVWLLVRFYVAYEWITSGLSKVNNPAWTVTGEALKGYWTNAVGLGATAKTSIAFDWYRGFIQGMLDSGSYVWFAKLVAIGEFTIGIALILGIFTGVFAFLGGFMNWNFMMAGSASVNPLFFVIAVGLILAWKVSGYIGADFFLLRWLGTPWRGKKVEQVEEKAPNKVPAGAAAASGK